MKNDYVGSASLDDYIACHIIFRIEFDGDTQFRWRQSMKDGEMMIRATGAVS